MEKSPFFIKDKLTVQEDLAPKKLFDETLSQQRKLRAFLSATSSEVFFLAEHLARGLEERLRIVRPGFRNALALFDFTGHTVQALRKSQKAEKISRIETCAQFLQNEEGFIANIGANPFPSGKVDMIASLLVLHEINDPKEMLDRIHNALHPNGLFLAALLGGETLQELRESLLIAEDEIHGATTPRVFPFMNPGDLGLLLQQAGFCLSVVDVETLNIRYKDLFSLMADLRGMGGTNTLFCRTRKPAVKKFFKRAAEIYAERFCDSDGRIRATFSIIWLSGWTPA